MSIIGEAGRSWPVWRALVHVVRADGDDLAGASTVPPITVADQAVARRLRDRLSLPRPDERSEVAVVVEQVHYVDLDMDDAVQPSVLICPKRTMPRLSLVAWVVGRPAAPEGAVGVLAVAEARLEGHRVLELVAELPHVAGLLEPLERPVDTTGGRRERK